MSYAAGTEGAAAHDNRKLRSYAAGTEGAAAHDNRKLRSSVDETSASPDDARKLRSSVDETSASPDDAPAQPPKPTPGAAGGLVAATRPGNVLLAGIGCLVGALASAHPPDTLLPTLLPFLGATLLGGLGTASGNLLNAITDRELDRSAHPTRPIPSGRLPTPLAINATVLLFLATTLLAFLLSVAAGLLALALAVLLILYETRLKATGLPGNLAVAVAAGALFPLGALAVGGTLTAPLVLGAVAGLAHLGRELLKDAEDVAADAAVRQTFAVRHGPRSAARLAIFPLLFAVIAAPLPVPLAGWSPWYLALILPSLLLFLATASHALRDAARAQRLAKLAMVFAILAFLLGTLL